MHALGGGVERRLRGFERTHHLLDGGVRQRLGGGFGLRRFGDRHRDGLWKCTQRGMALAQTCKVGDACHRDTSSVAGRQVRRPVDTAGENGRQPSRATAS